MDQPPITEGGTPVEEAPFVLPRRRPQADTEVDITPMIDIVFLLLIFFIVTSKLDEAGAPALPEARYGEPVPAKNSVVITVHSLDDQGNIAIYKGDGQAEGTELAGGDPATRQAELAEYVEQGLRGPPTKQHVLLKADKNVQQRDIQFIQQAVGRVEGVSQLFIAVQEVQ